MKSSMLEGTITHIRTSVIKRVFKHKFPWWVLRFSDLPLLEKKLWGFSSRKMSLYTYLNTDHVNIEHFLSTTSFFDNGEEIKDIIHITNPRCFGYVFNPVSFYIIEGNIHNHAVIEIGNTFGELKPYYVSPQHFSHQSFFIKIKKEFYISPFLSIQNNLEFSFKWDEQKIHINIKDFNQDHKLELCADYQGCFKSFTPFTNVFIFLKYPLHTLFIITLIHWHAFVLWLRKIPWFSKHYLAHDQKGIWKWKHQKFQPINVSER